VSEYIEVKVGISGGDPDNPGRVAVRLADDPDIEMAPTPRLYVKTGRAQETEPRPEIRLSDIHAQLAATVETLGEVAYSSKCADVLKRVAIAAGVDHTREPTWVIEQIGEELAAARESAEMVPPES